MHLVLLAFHWYCALIHDIQRYFEGHRRLVYTVNFQPMHVQLHLQLGVTARGNDLA
jgi:hypothetical protein